MMDAEGLKKLFDKFKSERKSITNRNSNVLIIDGLNLFIRTFSSSPYMNHRGEHVGGLLGFFKSLFSYIRRFNSTRVVIVFDGKDGGHTRRKKYPQYKSGRKSKDTYNRYADVESITDEQESFTRQISRLDKYLDILPITTIIVDYIEADDVIGYMASEYFPTQDVNEIVIVSSDTDFAQLVTHNVKWYRPTTRRLYDVAETEREFGVSIDNVLILKTMTGDTNDNIAGVNGIQKKTAVKIFPELRERELTVDDIIDIAKKRISEGSKSKIYPKVVEFASSLKLNYELMQLHDVDIPILKKMFLRGILDEPFNKLNRKQFREMAMQDGIYGQIDNFESWLLTSLSQLDSYGQLE